MAVVLFTFYLTFIKEFRTIRVDTVITIKERYGYSSIDDDNA